AANGGLVTKDELMAKVWPGLTVEENNLQVHISALRKALDEGGDSHSHIITVPGRGYRLAGMESEGGGIAAFSLPDKPSIAVLPFTNLTGDPDQDYLAEGMAEDIITQLSRISGLFVISRNSSFTYKDRIVDVRDIGRELGVRYVLEGSVRISGL